MKIRTVKRTIKIAATPTRDMAAAALAELCAIAMDQEIAKTLCAAYGIER